ncbi:hypothetical protein D9619_006058 [Psilocybe cf. subviscida]|uniref:Amidohydrolase-related domain-containing protein n=1 Tax=Psilocybe cf. subviscida TaxID=2480587 RepID=A0A8H5BXQ9_9AGAR|nr:hypothetical protein D9619_006058 [Psilocybe cf. subviscida]
MDGGRMRRYRTRSHPNRGPQHTHCASLSLTINLDRLTFAAFATHKSREKLLHDTQEMVLKDEAVYIAAPPPRRSTRLRHLLSYLALLSAAVTLSTVLPSPWSIFRETNTTSIKLEHVQRGDPALEWKDNIWPLRKQTPWDISTDFPYPRKLEYDVKEGTWLRLDVHPTSGDVVFDMVGDIYCLPGGEALHASGGAPVNARPVLQGVPHDSDPRFSPEGDRLVFRSDAGLGVDNIWIMEWKGCDAMNLKRPDLRHLLDNREAEEGMLAQGIKEDFERKYNRLMREGRFGALRVTNETYRSVTDARFHPSGSKVIATKWYTSERSLGAGEGWEYQTPSLDDLRSQNAQSISVGSGKVLVGRTLPRGWTVEQYADQQIGPEQLLWKGNDTIIFSKNVVDELAFTYSKDVHAGIYAIFARNLTTGVTEIIVNSLPGGASRPELSRDGRTLAFVRRVRDKEALVFKDLLTGSIHNIWHGLTYDLSTVSAPMGTYPTFAFTPDDDAVVIWAAGQIYLVPLSKNSHGEKVASSTSPRPIPFRARIEKRLAETRRSTTDLVALESQDAQPVTAFRDLRVDQKGHHIVFEAGGLTYWQKVGAKKAHRVPALDEQSPYYSASFVSGTDFVIHTQWSDSTFSSFELADVKSGKAFAIQGLPLGRYFSPVLCECRGTKRTIAFLKNEGTYLTGDILATAQPGLYLADVVLPDGFKPQKLQLQNIRFVPSDIDVDGRVNMRFIEKNKKLLVQQTSRAFVIDFEGKTDKLGKYPRATLSEGKMAAEFAVSTRTTNKGHIETDNAAFVDFFNVYFAPGSAARKGDALWSKPGNATKGLVRVSLDGGHDITWSPNGNKLFWFLGPYLHSLDVSRLDKCSSAIKNDHLKFGISCVKSLLDFDKVVVEHETDIARLKKEAKAKHLHEDIQQKLADSVLVINATILTMESGMSERHVIRDGVLFIRGGIIEYVGGPREDLTKSLPGITVIDARGGFVIPGFIDVHAHWNGFSDKYPTKSWELETFLAYGVTTAHNPSSDTVGGFVERTRVENGQMIGPRIFSTGIPIYGGEEAGMTQDIVDMDEARSALIRIKVEGGAGAISYKNYNLPSRASRQRLLKAARDVSMLCVPEGGMNYNWDLTYIIDGMTTVEHALPVPRLFDDVLTLYALSGTGSTPTHVVNYGGAWGEQVVWAKENVANDPKLRQFTRHDILEGITESTTRPDNSFAFYNTSASIADMVELGQLTHIGAHGEPPLGLNYHAEMGFASAGGLTNYEVIRAATSSAAKTLGVFDSIGSLSRGKLADFLIYPPGVDLLEGEISSKTRQLIFVARNGRIWDANTMVEFWPSNGKKQTMPIINAE